MNKRMLFLPAIILSISVSAQELRLVTDMEFTIPTEHPWGITYHNDYFWISDVENGDIIKIHENLEIINKIKAPRNQITGLTFEKNALWVVADAWDTIGLPHLCSKNTQMFKLNPETGEKLDSLIVPYYNASPEMERYILGLSYFNSNFFVSYNGGYGPCLYRLNPDDYLKNTLCCAHPGGLETIHGELWTVRMNALNGTGNFIVPLSISDSSSSEEWNRRMNIDFFASDLAFDGTHFWLCDPAEKKMKRMVIDTIYKDTLPTCFSIDNLEIIPQNPTINDVIKVVCHSTFSSGGCNLKDSEIVIDSTGLEIIAYHEVGILTYICHSTDTISIGKLPKGYHVLDYSLTAINLNCGVVHDYIDFYIEDTIPFTAYLELIPEQPMAGEEIIIISHGVCNMHVEINFAGRNITLYAYYYSCSLAPCGTDSISIGFLTPDSYTLNYYLIDKCVSEPEDSLVYFERMKFNVDQALKTGNSMVSAKIEVYPNPASETIYIENVTPGKESYVEILDLKGQLIRKWNFINSSDMFEININEIDPGLYLLRVISEDYYQTCKVIIQ